MRILDQHRPLSDLTGEELLLMAIASAPGNRRRIQQELSYRAVLAEETRRTRVPAVRPRLHLVRSSAA